MNISEHIKLKFKYIDFYQILKIIIIILINFWLLKHVLI
jgi:hypothetical protein